ncbi:ATP cone domain-containing protein [Bacteroides sp. BFG-638]|uniref:ATP cone domain-containing protein n=1 Tax=Bacteroides sp. BFG-638 TaxID=2972765 RepID=UPI0038D4B82C
MNYAEICIIKRDGKREDFSISKIKNAISKAFSATGFQDEQQLVADITMNVISQFTTPTITVEEIQDLVEKSLMKVRPEVAKKYIIYREWRNTERDKKTQMEASDGRHRCYRQERCQLEQCQHEQSHACRPDDDVRFRSNQRLYV